MGRSVAPKLRRVAFLFVLLAGYFMSCGPVNAQTGSVSGTVFEGDGVTPIQGIAIRACSERCYILNAFSYLNFATTNGDGEYTLAGLPEGTVYIKANQWSPSRPPGPYDDEPYYNANYEAEWYGGQIRCDEAAPVTVTAGEDAPNVNFQLNDAGVISGTIYESDGVTPIGILPVYAVSSPCANEIADFIGDAWTDDSGAYTIEGLHEGDVFVYTGNNGMNYVNQWFPNEVDCNEAGSVTVVAGESVANIDFQLNEGGIISGKVYSNYEDGVNGLILYAYSEKCGEVPIASGLSGTDGRYDIVGLPPGDVYLKASENWVLDSNYYAEEWYDDVHSCIDADPVGVIVGEETGDIDFHLYTRTDDDEDDMPDDWEIEIFGDVSRDGTGDYDSDGITDLDEYLAGTNPKVGQTNPDGDSDTQQEPDNGTDDQGASDGGGGCFISTMLE